MNKVILIGNLTPNPETTRVSNGADVCKFSLAVARKFLNSEGEKETDYINIIAWRTLAENCAKYLTKGSKCCVIGRMQTRSYDAQDGSRRHITEVIADEVEFLATKKIDENENIPF